MSEVRDMAVTGPSGTSSGQTRPPATLQVCRYVVRTRTLRPVIGEFDIGIPAADLKRHAAEALRRNQFMAYTLSLPDHFDTDELCFVPRGAWCDILSIRVNGWRRHHGDHRRGLTEILSDLAAAVACGKLRILSAEELELESTRGAALVELDLAGPASVARAREAVEAALAREGLGGRTCGDYVLCVSEAASNMLLHGGGGGTLTLRRLADRLRAVIADEGPGLNFANWTGPPSPEGQASMGYGLKIIVDNLDTVGLHTGDRGTTLLLDRITTTGR